MLSILHRRANTIPLLDFITVPVQDLKNIKSLIVGPKYKQHYTQDIDLHILKPHNPTANSIKKLLQMILQF